MSKDADLSTTNTTTWWEIMYKPAGNTVSSVSSAGAH